MHTATQGNATLPPHLNRGHRPDLIETGSPLDFANPRFQPCFHRQNRTHHCVRNHLELSQFGARTACRCALPYSLNRNTVAHTAHTCTGPSSCTPNTASSGQSCSQVLRPSDSWAHCPAMMRAPKSINTAKIRVLDKERRTLTACSIIVLRFFR